MKRLLSILFTVLISMGAVAQSDVISVKEALTVFRNGKLANAKTVLQKEGYKYSGVSNLAGKDYCWAKNVELSKDFLPQRYSKGNSSIFMLSTSGKSAFLYVYNQHAYAGLKAQVRNLGYTIQKEKNGTILCTHDDQPTISFMQFEMPYPFCMMITE